MNDIFHNFYNSNLDALFNFYFREYDLNENGIYERNTRAEGLGRFMTISETHPPCGLG